MQWKSALLGGAIASALFVTAGRVFSDDPPMDGPSPDMMKMMQPGPEHERLKQYEGSWEGKVAPGFEMLFVKGTLLESNKGTFKRQSMSLGGLGGDELRSPVRFTVPAGSKMMLRNVRLNPDVRRELFNGKDLAGWKVFDANPRQAKSKFGVTKEGEVSGQDVGELLRLCLDLDGQLGVAAAGAAELVDGADEADPSLVHDHGVIADSIDVGQEMRRQHDRAAAALR